MARNIFWVRVGACSIHFYLSLFISHQFSLSNQSKGPQINTPWPETAVFIHSHSLYKKVNQSESKYTPVCVHARTVTCLRGAVGGVGWISQSTFNTVTLYRSHSSAGITNKFVTSQIKRALPTIQPLLHLPTETVHCVVLSVWVCSLLKPAFTVLMCIYKCCTPILNQTMLHSI